MDVRTAAGFVKKQRAKGELRMGSGKEDLQLKAFNSERNPATLRRYCQGVSHCISGETSRTLEETGSAAST